MRARMHPSVAPVVELKRYSISAAVFSRAHPYAPQIKFYKTLATSRAHALDRIGITPEQLIMIKVDEIDPTKLAITVETD
jgi:hypothetical protein